jgi:integrase/recombinase XerD
MLVSQMKTDFMSYVHVTKSKGTFDFYSFYVKRIEQFFKDIDVNNIHKTDITSFISYIKNQSPSISNASINKYLTTLKTMIKYSTDRTVDYRKLKEDKAIIPTISQQTINRIFEYYKQKMHEKVSFRNYLLLKLLLDTGLRINEALHIKVNDIDIMTNTIHVKITKTKNDRYVIFTNSTKDLLTRYLLYVNPQTLLFYNFKTNEPITTSTVETIVSRLKKQLNFEENITPHKWRHTFATNYLNSGGNLEILRLIMGHSSLKTTQKYLHLSKNDIVNNYMSVMRHTD